MPPPIGAFGLSLIFLFGLIWGSFFWMFNSWFNNPPYPYSPTITANFIWMTAPTIVVGYTGFARFLILAAGLYVGIFLVHLPLMPADPLLPLGLILGIPFTLAFSFLGSAAGFLAREITKNLVSR